MLFTKFLHHRNGALIVQWTVGTSVVATDGVHLGINDILAPISTVRVLPYLTVFERTSVKRYVIIRAVTIAVLLALRSLFVTRLPTALASGNTRLVAVDEQNDIVVLQLKNANTVTRFQRNALLTSPNLQTVVVSPPAVVNAVFAVVQRTVLVKRNDAQYVGVGNVVDVIYAVSATTTH